MLLLTPEQAGQLDSQLIANFGIPQAVLMEHAALAALSAVRSVLATHTAKDKTILVVCGQGHNGGDGLALARLLHARGAEITVLICGDSARYTGASRDNFRVVRNLDARILNLEASPEPAFLSGTNLSGFDLVVDALFGVGLNRTITGPHAALIDSINSSPVPVLSLDIPSGIHAGTGAILGTAIQADATVCFGLPKIGNILYPGFGHGGTLYHSDIAIPPEALAAVSSSVSTGFCQTLPTRDPLGHKGSFGKVMVIGGAPSYPGAPAFSAASALLGGAGYVVLALPSALAAPVFSLVPEAVLMPLESGSGYLGTGHAAALLQRSERMHSVVLGPGLSRFEDSQELVHTLLEGIQCPLVIDGDALSAIAGHEELLRARKTPTVLTPHEGEMAVLLGTDIGDITEHRPESACEAAERYASVVVLKGAHSLVASGSGSGRASGNGTDSGRVWINLTGNSGMATAGSGDILAGLAGYFLTRLPPHEAAECAVHIHGLAGDLAAGHYGQHGTGARHILGALPEAMTRVLNEQQEGTRDPCSGRIIPISPYFGNLNSISS